MFPHCCVPSQVTCEGQLIGAIVADSAATARRAAELVEIEYEELEAILTIEVRDAPLLLP